MGVFADLSKSGCRGERDADWCKKEYTASGPNGEAVTKTKLCYKGYDKSTDSLRYGFKPQKHDKRIFRIKCEEDRRIFTPVARDSHKWKRLYKKRTGVEWINGRVDRDYKFEKHTIRGDVLMELNHDSRVNIELQIEMLAYWDKRSLFYLSKLFTEGLLSGQKYEKLRRCVCISVLGFNLDERPEYHKVYRLRDEAGNEFSDMLEIHVIELSKPLSGMDE